MKTTETKKQVKLVKFAKSEQFELIRSMLKVMEPLMPEKDRGVITRGIMWAVGRVKAMFDDQETLLKKLKGISEEAEKTAKELAVIKEAFSRVECERDEARRELIEEREKKSLSQLIPLPRTIDETKRLISNKRCPICGGLLGEWRGNDGKERVTCKDCRYFVWGTIDNPQISR